MNTSHPFPYRAALLAAIVLAALALLRFPAPTQAQGQQCENRATKTVPPTEIWVEINTFFSTDWGRPQPFAHSTPFTLDEYTSGVLLGELGPNVDSVTNADLPSDDGSWKDVAMEALAVAIRSLTWFRLNYASQFTEPHYITLDGLNQCGFYDTGAQTFRPHYAGVPQVIKDHYTAIVTQHVPNIYLVEEDGTEPIDAEYRATVGEYSDTEGTKDYLISIFDPVSAGDPDPANVLGIAVF